jgi:glycosyltransferase involved in cell wall biosynthesis
VENAGVAAAFADRHHIPFILDIRDHWPEELTHWFPRMARPLARMFLTPLYRTAKRAARSASAITGVTRLQRDYGLKLAGRKVDSTRDHVFYLGYTRHPVSAPARVDAASWWRAQGLKADAKIAAFTGTVGFSFDFAPIIAAARRLKSEGRQDIQFVLAGDGGTRAKVIAEAGDLAGDLILFPGWIDQAKIDALLSGSTVALAPYIPNTSMSLPNKFFEYMAYGLPVLSSCTGESEDLIRQYNFGVQYDPKNHDGFYEALRRIIEEPDTAKAMGDAALTLFEKQFDQSMLFAQMERHLATLTRNKDAA